MMRTNLSCIRLSHRKPHSGASRQGAALVEFAIMVPILFVLFFACVEFSRVAMIRHTIDNAVYEAARAAIVPGGNATDAQSEARRILSAMGIVNSSVEITPRTLTRSTPEVSVRINVPLDSNSYVPPQFFAGRTVTRELTMQREGIRVSP
jgi:Flp pilus assembly protein TadG